MASNSRANRLLILKPEAQKLISVLDTPDGTLDAAMFAIRG